MLFHFLMHYLGLIVSAAVPKFEQYILLQNNKKSRGPENTAIEPRRISGESSCGIKAIEMQLYRQYWSKLISPAPRKILRMAVGDY